MISKHLVFTAASEMKLGEAVGGEYVENIVNGKHGFAIRCPNNWASKPRLFWSKVIGSRDNKQQTYPDCPETKVLLLGIKFKSQVYFTDLFSELFFSCYYKWLWGINNKNVHRPHSIIC